MLARWCGNCRISAEFQNCRFHRGTGRYAAARWLPHRDHNVRTLCGKGGNSRNTPVSGGGRTSRTEARTHAPKNREGNVTFRFGAANFCLPFTSRCSTPSSPRYTQKRLTARIIAGSDDSDASARTIGTAHNRPLRRPIKRRAASSSSVTPSR